MDTIKEILNGVNENNTDKVLEILKKINDTVLANEDIHGKDSVRIGMAYVHVKENEDCELFETKQLGDLFIYLNEENPEKVFYVSDWSTKFLSFFDKFGRLEHGRHFTVDEISQVKLFKDAYERICEKIQFMVEYENKQYCNNENLIEAWSD